VSVTCTDPERRRCRARRASGVPRCAGRPALRISLHARRDVTPHRRETEQGWRGAVFRDVSRGGHGCFHHDVSPALHALRGAIYFRAMTAGSPLSFAAATEGEPDAMLRSRDSTASRAASALVRRPAHDVRLGSTSTGPSAAPTMRPPCPRARRFAASVSGPV